MSRTVLQSKDHFCTFFKLLLDSSSLQLSNAATLKPHWLAAYLSGLSDGLYFIGWHGPLRKWKMHQQPLHTVQEAAHCARGLTDLLPVCLGSPISALLGDTILCTGVSNLHKAHNILIKLDILVIHIFHTSRAHFMLNMLLIRWYRDKTHTLPFDGKVWEKL